MTRATPLRRDDALRLLRAAASDIECRHNIRPIGLFGSVARDEADPQSDVDVLVEYVGPVGMRELFGAIDDLEKTLGARVDLVSVEELKPRAREFVTRDLVRVA